jgi:DNA-binding FadR family transcriptional regulator
LLAASGNAFIVSLTISVNAAIAWTTIFKQRAVRLPRDPMPDHVRVFDAVSTGDREAAHAAMKDLVRLTFLDTNEARGRKKDHT